MAGACPMKMTRKLWVILFLLGIIIGGEALLLINSGMNLENGFRLLLIAVLLLWAIYRLITVGPGGL